ncbi:MAG TPA: polysaccharide biosynthesis protein [Gemmatimonadales bacterium]|nr:polysaccharide biosynthesis protein [Gemmatimonadales bacterium]
MAVGHSLRSKGSPRHDGADAPSPEHHVNSTAIQADLGHRVVLLTGAAGSIGSELAHQIAAIGPERLVLLDQSESDLDFLHLELLRAHPALDLVPLLCDITDQSRLAQAYARHHPEYVIHAAAYKHVPLMETNLFEAVRNNVLGTLLVATNAVRYGATKVLLVSSDQAIRPSSVIGATKRVAERIIFSLPSLHRAGTDFRAVRFGNVLASKGCVTPFERQLEAGGPATVTPAQAPRDFMSISEAARLVLQAGSLPAAAGMIALLEVAEPVRILDLAEKLLRSGPEATIPTSAEKIRLSQMHETAGLELVQQLSRLFAYLDAGDRDGLLSTLCELVPECVPPLRDYHTALVTPLNANATGAWAALADSTDSAWSDRRRGRPRPTEAPPLRLIDRREGEVCRRKAPRVGGRRRTDLGAPMGREQAGVTEKRYAI